MKIKISNKVYLSLVVLLILGISFVSAFSVSAPYMENKILYLTLDSGETDLQFVLQNGGGSTEDISIRTTILKGSEIISIVDEEQTYLVHPGDKVPVNLKITLPEDAKAGDSYAVALSFATVTVTGSGEFGFGTGQEQRFTAKVISKPEVEEPTKSNGTVLYLAIAVLFLLIAVFLVLSQRKTKKK